MSGEPIVTTLDKKAIQLERKKLFAELELSGETTIEMNGRSFTKNDIIQYYEDLLKEDGLKYHATVADDPVLLVFLETAHIGRKESFLKNPMYTDAQFINWVSPYFCHAFITFMNACFLDPDEDGLVALLRNKLLMTQADTEKGWQAVMKIVMGSISTLEEYYKSTGEVKLAKAKDLMEFRYIRLVQLLPNDRFGPVKDKYAFSILQACVFTFNRNRQTGNYVSTWLENAQLLAASEEVIAQIAKKREELEAVLIPQESGPVYGGSGAGAPAQTSPWGVIKLILFIVLFLVRLATCRHW
ncbi:hypothetical protein A4D02_05400 [Niastella koreensis]|uniref:Uncharacterized protein n=1 Tax=Niastella koreensis TaxID=354356 RepID=A0ABX3NWZ2_9BACT|nr:hypothetical protein A4D02_05400 [Niastella koreensis]